MELAQFAKLLIYKYTFKSVDISPVKNAYEHGFNNKFYFLIFFLNYLV